MWVWGRAHQGGGETATVARAAVDGKARHDLVKEAVRTLLTSGQADRFGVWVESTDDVSSFRGIVAEKEGGATPAEWSRLSPEPPLPAELLVGLQTVEQEVGETPDRPVIGAVVEMRRALWVPVAIQGHLRGVLFAGQEKKQAHLPRALLESVAAELALAMELEDERRRGREHHEDCRSVRSVLAALAGSESPSELLENIVKDCTDKGARKSGPGAVFAAIGRLFDSLETREQSPQPAAQTMRFPWHSGDAAWIHALNSEPLSAIWRRALESHRVAGSEPGTASSLGEVVRVVALPLEAGGKSLGVLVAGMCRSGASLAAVERLELRAALATPALLRQKNSEEAVAQELRQQALLAAVAAATILVRADGSIAQLSEGAQALLGTSRTSPRQAVPAANASEDFAQLFSIADAPRVKAWLQKISAPPNGLATTREVPLEAELRNGARVQLQSLFSMRDGSVGVLLERLHERSEKVQTDQSITEIMNVIEWLEEGVVLFGANREVRALNSRFGQIVGLTPEELGGIKTLDDLVATLGARTADASNFGGSWRSLDLSAESAVREELHLVRPVPRLLERAARPILDEKGALLGRVEIYRDLTAQRVFQSKLLQTEKLAELGQMVTGIAHELSNPLTSILGYAQRLLLRRDPMGGSHEARQIFQEADRAGAILRQLLLSARDSRPERRRVALNQVASHALELQRFSLAADNVHVQLDLDPVLPFVQGDAGQLQQVLMNLIGNARQAIEEQGRGGTIRVKTKRIAEKRVLLEVSDDGPGIPQAIQARIFDPFFTTKPAGVGTGLGLAIVLGIVREHGGRLHLTSNLGQGAVFSIEFPAMAASEMSLPATRGAAPARPRLEPSPAPESLETAHAGAALGAWAGTRVLVLEDEPTVARLIADVLEDEGLRVDVLLDAREALDRATREDYALAVCDMKMPELDGEHFYQALARANNPLRERFLFVTGDVLAAHTRDFLERYHLPHVEKPFRVEELTEKIRSVLEATSPLEPLRARVAKKNAARK
ncbi:MAG TPA: ATP-binding protein [Candidatus Acidoferrum sp.]|nr:ATP-binding protein [Candidatus Acidoferrum sp.]